MTHTPWHELLHLTAAAVLAGGGAVFVLLAWRARSGAPVDAARGQSGRSQIPVALTIASVALALGAATIHLAAAPVHIEELGAVGWGFLGAAAFQAAWALAYAIDRTPGVATVGIVGNGAIVAAWLLSRTVGLPVGPLAGVPEPVATADATATIFELLLIGLLVARLGRLDAQLVIASGRTPGVAAIALVPVIGILFLATTLAVTRAGDHGHGHAPVDQHAGDHALPAVPHAGGPHDPASPATP